MVRTAMCEKHCGPFFVVHFHYRKGKTMEVIKFSLDLSDFDRQDWEEDGCVKSFV